MASSATTALVTGASSGIGEATARRLAREPGAELVLVARREERLRALAESLPCRATYLAVDLTERRRPASASAPTSPSTTTGLDLLVNNAGAAWRGTFAEAGYANVHRHMELNFDAVVRLTEALLPLLRASAPSAIVNVASTAGRVSRARTGAYSASKFALIGWTDSLYAEERPHGVHVGLVLPASSPPRASRRPSCARKRSPAGSSPSPRRSPRRSSRPARGGKAERYVPRPYALAAVAAHRRPAPGPPRPLRRRRLEPHHQHRGRSRRRPAAGRLSAQLKREAVIRQ